MRRRVGWGCCDGWGGFMCMGCVGEMGGRDKRQMLASDSNAYVGKLPTITTTSAHAKLCLATLRTVIEARSCRVMKLFYYQI